MQHWETEPWSHIGLLSGPIGIKSAEALSLQHIAFRSQLSGHINLVLDFILKSTFLAKRTEKAVASSWT